LIDQAGFNVPLNTL